MIVHLLLVAHPFILKYGIAEYHHSSSTSAAAAVYTAVHGKSVIARDRERQPSTNQITALTRATPAIYQSYLPDGRNHPAYIAHRVRTRTYKNAQHTAAHATMDVQSRHRTVSVDDGLEVIMWIRCLGGARLPTASYALRPNLSNLFFSPRREERSRFFCRLFSTHQATTHL